VIPSSSNRKCREGSANGELMIGLAMTRFGMTNKTMNGVARLGNAFVQATIWGGGLTRSSFKTLNDS
jgi:hypothetical protein